MEPLFGFATRSLATARPRLPPTSPFVCARCSQIRGKKTKRGPKAITIQLIQDIPGYGRQGSIIPVPIGQMRNWLLPGGLAKYVSQEERLRMRKEGITVERDVLFGREDKAAEAEAAAKQDIKIKYKPEPRQVDLNMLPPDKAYTLLESVVPPVLVYRRTPIASAAERNAAPSPSNPAQVAAPSPEQTPRQSPENIFGSVGASDITTSIKALLHQQALSGLVILPDEQVKFVNIGGEGSSISADRIKALGEFKYEIRIQGHDKPVKRSVRVVPDDEEPRDDSPNYEGSGLARPDGQIHEQKAQAIRA